MKTPVINHSSPWVTFLCLLLGIQLRAAQFVELTAEIETVDWHSEAVSRQPPWTVRCVVGTNAWPSARWIATPVARNGRRRSSPWTETPADRRGLRTSC